MDQSIKADWEIPSSLLVEDGLLKVIPLSRCYEHWLPCVVESGLFKPKSNLGGCLSRHSLSVIFLAN